MLPNLLHFIEGNGTLLTNNHTPLIAHTADDLLTTFTGLYGDRAGMPVSNSYQAYNADGTTDPASSFAYWTDPIYDTASHPNAGHDTNPSLVYSPTPPATTSPRRPRTRSRPAPWVPFTRAGCDVGDVSTVDQELENTAVDIPKVFGANSPEEQQLAADPDPYKDPETADYVGLAVHCATGSAFCATAKAVKYGQTTPDPDRRSRRAARTSPAATPASPALFGHKYIAPQLGAGTAERDAQRLPGDQRGRKPRRPERQRDRRRLPDQLPGLPRLLQHQRLADPGLHVRPAGERRARGQRIHLRPARERVHPGA